MRWLQDARCRMARLLASPKVTWGMLIVIGLAGAAAVWVGSRRQPSGDEWGYMELARGLMQRQYSWWNEFDPRPPDTFRTPGYPIFLALCSLGGTWRTGAFVGQIVAYFATCALGLSSLQLLRPNDRLARNVFLILFACSLPFLGFVPTVVPEVLVAMLLAAFVRVELGFYVTSKRAGSGVDGAPACRETTMEGGPTPPTTSVDPSRSLVAIAGLAAPRSPANARWAAMLGEAHVWRSHLLVGLCLGLAILVRPIFILVPLLRAGGFAVRKRHLLPALASLMVSFALILPYGVWNHTVHGHFSLTPLEGGAPNAHLGFWQFRLGDHPEPYWGQVVANTFLAFTTPEERAEFGREYDAEWQAINAEVEPLLSREDRERLPTMLTDHHRFPTFSSDYTIGRAKAINRYTWAHVRREPGYYLLTRLYMAFRLWYPGLPGDVFRQGIGNALLSITVTVNSILIYFGGAICIALAALRKSIRFAPAWPILFIVLYGWLVYLPMGIQSRYVLPVRCPLLILIATAIASLVGDRLLKHSNSVSPVGESIDTPQIPEQLPDANRPPVTT